MTRISTTLPLLLATILLLPFGLAGCGTLEGEKLSSGFNLKLGVPTTRKIAQSPPEVYTRVASQVHACWLGGEEPLLPDHQFFAEAPSGNGEARILLHGKPKDESRKRGRLVYTIKMKPVAGGTVVSTDSYQIKDVAQQNQMQRAVVMWAHGASDCDAGSQPEGEQEGSQPLASSATPAAGEGGLKQPAKAGAAEPRELADLPPLPVRRPRHLVKQRMNKQAPVAAAVKPKAVRPKAVKPAPVRAAATKPAAP